MDVVVTAVFSFSRRYRIHVDGDKGYKRIQLVSGMYQV